MNSYTTKPEHKRRRLLKATAAAALILGAHKPGSTHAGQQQKPAPIAQPQSSDNATFMTRAFEMRQLAVDYGDQAYGAVVVHDGMIFGQSWSRVVIDKDPTAHAELAAIRDAAYRLNNRHLDGAILYSSSRPCPMCEAAAYWAGISRMIHGRNLDDAGPPQLCR